MADTPGHEQYTRNMVTGASTADLAIILIDARKGVLTQTRRHSYLVSLLGIKHVVLAVNKMDLMDYSQDVCRAASRPTIAAFAAQIGIEDVRLHPDVGRVRRQRVRPQRRDAVVQRSGADGAPRDGADRTGARRRARSVCRCSG